MFSKIKNKKIILLSVSVVLLAGSMIFSYFAKAQTSAECLGFEEDSDERKKCEELAEKAQKYKEIIEIKQRQQESLNNQIDVMDANIGQYETEIELSNKKIDELKNKIARKQIEIKEKEDNILFQKELLSGILRSVYDRKSHGVVTTFITSTAVENFLASEDSVSQLGIRMSSLLDELKSAKLKLEQEKNSLEEDNIKLTKVHIELKDKNENLETVKSQKENLLNQTQGEEARYQKMLEKVEAQKLELLNLDELYATSGLSVDDFKKPDSKYHASLSWFYSQRDPRWGNLKIGNSKSLLKDYGCAVSAVAMVWTNLGSTISPKELAEKDQYFQWDLIAWPKTWKSISLSSSGSSHGNISWSKIDSEIGKGNPVIIYIGKSGGNGGHYVVIHSKDKSGKYVVHDPYFGPNIFLDTSRALVGAMGSKTSTYMDQMIIYNK